MPPLSSTLKSATAAFAVLALTSACAGPDASTSFWVIPIETFDARIDGPAGPMPAHAWLVVLEGGDGVMRPHFSVRGYAEAPEGAPPGVRAGMLVRWVDGSIALRPDNGDLSGEPDGELNGFHYGNEATSTDVDEYTLTLDGAGAFTLEGSGLDEVSGARVPVSAWGQFRTACAEIGPVSASWRPGAGTRSVAIDLGRTLIVNCDGSGYVIE